MAAAVLICFQRRRRIPFGSTTAASLSGTGCSRTKCEARALEPLVERLQALQPLSRLGVLEQQRLEARALRSRRFSIEQRIDLDVGDRLALSHFTLRNEGELEAPLSSSLRSRSRPRDSRDITVPMGTPSTSAVSA